MEELLYTYNGEQVPVRSVIRHSEKVDLILPAMLKAQKAIAFATKDSENPHFHSSYASLNAYIAACKEHYNDNDIVVIQGVGGTDELVVVATRLAHTSGQWYGCEMSGAPEKSGPQPKGSVITYFRRYTLAAVGFMGAEDDDGNAGQERPKPAKPRKSSTKKKDPEEPAAPDRAKSLEVFHKEWVSLVAEVEDGDEADAHRDLENVFLWAQTDADTVFSKKKDYMRPLKAERIDGLSLMVKAEKANIIGWLESDDVRASIGLPTLSVQTCAGCAVILSPGDKAKSDTVGLDKGYCVDCRPKAVVAMMKEKKGAGTDAG
jgi:hypothetical protein